MKAWPALAIFTIQIILFLGHWLIYATWVAFWPCLAPHALPALRIAMLILAFSFVAASLLAFRFSNALVRLVYTLAAVWLGFVNFFFWASLLVWITWLVLRLFHSPADPAAVRPLVAAVFFVPAFLAGVYGVFNARMTRVRRLSVQLPGLPASWRGRRAVMLSDLHLGPIYGARFCRRIANLVTRFAPDIVFLPGDLFDGTKADLDRLIAPLREIRPPLGFFFSTGNHEEFTDPAHYLEAVTRAGIRVLGSELFTVDGVQVAGVFYHDSSSPLRMKAALDGMRADGALLDRNKPAILLNHAPTRLPIVEQAGFSLQLSGHTHGGQVPPYTWITQSIYGRFTSGLNRFGALQVYTSTGAGTWGPPLRVGPRPEIVYLTFE